MNLLSWITEHWKQIGEAIEVIGANIYAFYAFICNHGGLIPMWNSFIGEKGTVSTASPDKPTLLTVPQTKTN